MPLLVFGALGAAGVAGVAGFAGCTRDAPSGEAAAFTLRAHLTAQPVSLDPALAEDGVSLKVLGNLWDGLVRVDAAGGVQGAAARSWEWSDGGRVLLLTLRSGAKWSDGVPLEAAHFVLGLERSLWPDRLRARGLTPPPDPVKLAPMLSAIERADAPAPDRLRIRLRNPAPYVLPALALSLAYPAREDLLRSSKDGRWDARFPTTGPYRVTEVEPERRIVLEATRPHSGPRRVEFLIVGEEAAALPLFESGRLDLLTRVPVSAQGRLWREGRLRIAPYPATYYLAFNVRRGPGASRETRCAVARAIRKAEVVASLQVPEIAQAGISLERPARSWLPPGFEGFRPWESPAKTPPPPVVAPRARALVALRLDIDAGARNGMVAEKLQADLKSAGFALEIRAQDWKTHVKQLSTAPSDLYRFGWLSPFNDPVPHLQVFVGANANNYTGWSDARYDQLVAQIERIPAGAQREALARRADELLTDEACVAVPLYHYVQIHAVGPRVSGFAVNLFGLVRFDELRVLPGKTGG